MPNPATYDDVNLILRLYEMRREERLRQARDWFAKSFKAKTVEEFNKLCPAGWDTLTNYRMVTTYWEMAASFVTAGVLNEDLFFDSGLELLLVWERIKTLLPALRETMNSPRMLENLETVAAGFIARIRKQGDGVYEAMSARMSEPAGPRRG